MRSYIIPILRTISPWYLYGTDITNTESSTYMEISFVVLGKIVKITPHSTKLSLFIARSFLFQFGKCAGELYVLRFAQITTNRKLIRVCNICDFIAPSSK